MFGTFWDNNVDQIKSVLLIFGIFAAIIIYLAKKHNLPDLEKKVNKGLIVAAVISMFSFYNFGFMHFGGGIFHTHDLYHYYMGSKYFKDDGYLYLYDATIVADEETNNYMAQVKEIKDQTNYKLIPRETAHTSEDKWRTKFTNDEWNEFKRDLVWFQKQPHDWHWWGGIVSDFGYNPSPVWTMIASRISNAIPTSSQIGMLFIAYLDGILALIMLFMIYKAFGPQVCLFSTLYWGSAFAYVFAFTGASMLRHDWIVYLVISICLLKMLRPYSGGLFFALSAGLRIFPSIFIVPLLAKFVAEYVEEKKIDMLSFRFLVSIGFFLAVLILFTFTFVPGDWGSWPAFIAKMKLHKQSWNTWNWGFVDIFIYRGQVYDNLPGNWKENADLAVENARPIITILQIATMGMLCLAGSRLKSWEAVAIGGCAAFMFVNPTKYYLVYLITLIPFYTARLDQFWRVCGLIALFSIDIILYFMRSFNETAILQQFMFCVMIYILFLYTIVAAYLTNRVKNV